MLSRFSNRRNSITKRSCQAMDQLCERLFPGAIREREDMDNDLATTLRTQSGERVYYGLCY